MTDTGDTDDDDLDRILAEKSWAEVAVHIDRLTPDMTRVANAGSETQQTYANAMIRVFREAHDFVRDGRLTAMWAMMQSSRIVLHTLDYTMMYGDDIEASSANEILNLRLGYSVTRANDMHAYDYLRCRLPVYDKNKCAHSVYKFIIALSEVRHHDDVRRVQWKQTVANLITEGEQLNVHIAYREKLEAVMRTMTENILEAPRG